MGHQQSDAYRERPSSSLTRRSWLQRMSCVIAAAALPARAQTSAAHLSPPATESAAPVINKLSAYMSEAGNRALPPDVIEKTKQHVLDTFAAMISGADLPPGRVALRFAHAHAGEKVATVVGSDVLCGAIEAALVNGMLAHADETDDSHAPSHSHPGCSIVPAALASGEQFGISGTRFLRAVA